MRLLRCLLPPARWHAVIAIACLCIPLPASAQATAAALSLNGVKRVNLRFVLTEDDIASGVDTARLRGTIESKLGTRSISLVPGRAGGDGTIGVNAGAIRSSTGTTVTFFYFLEFRQQVKVSRLPDPPFPPVPATTWTSPVSFGTEPADRILEHLEGVTAELMDGFLQAHVAGQEAVKR